MAQQRWSPVTVTACGVLGAVAAALLCHQGLPWWVPAALAGCAGASVGVLLRRTGGTAVTVAHREACIIGAGAWASTVALVGWSTTVVVILLGAALVLGVLSPLVAGGDDTPGVEMLRGWRPISRRAAEWEERISTVLRRPIRVVDEEEWPGGSGVTLTLEPPAGEGLGVATLAQHCHALAEAARLPHGCTVRAAAGDDQGTARIKIMLRDHLAEELLLPEDWSMSSILDDWQIAIEPDGTTVMVNLRQDAAVLAGQRGSGKTTLEHRIIAQLARCPDALVWVVDLNGGGLGWPWIAPWACGTADRPVVDWVAGDAEEARRLLDTAVAIAKDRKIAYTSKKIALNTDLLPVSPDLPQIIVVVDEGGEVQSGPGARHVAERLDELVRIGRAEAVSPIVSVLRGTRGLLSADLATQSTIRLALRMDKDDEYAHVLGWEAKVRAADLRHVGCGYLRRTHDRAPVQVRTMRMMPDQIQRCASATAHLRPDLDERGRRIAGQAYACRWERAAGQLALLRGDDIPTPAPIPSTPSPRATAAVVAEEPGTAMRQRMRTRLIDARTEEEDTDDIARQLLAQLEAPTSGGGDTRERISAIVAEAGPSGITSAEIGQRLEDAGAQVTRQYRQAVLSRLVDEGVIRRDGGRYVPGQAAS